MSTNVPGLFVDGGIPSEQEEFLRRTNPWWSDRAQPALPTFRRWAFEPLLKRLHGNLAPGIVLKGPRQVGKTTLQQQVIEHLLRNEGVHPRRILRVQFDELPGQGLSPRPILDLAWWFERHVLPGGDLNASAREGTKAVLFFDEVQNLDGWAEQLKALVDHHSCRVVVTGSSALRIAYGADSLAGRLSTIEIGPLTLSEISELRDGTPLPPLLKPNGVEPFERLDTWRELREHGRRHVVARDRAFAAFAERGGYPVVHANAAEPWEFVAEQLNDMVVRRVIRHDLRVGSSKGRRRDEDLLQFVFQLVCRYAGQAPGPRLLLEEVSKALAGNVGAQRLGSYLGFLDAALLVRLVRPLEIRLKKSKGYPKLCLIDHALRASWIHETVPLTAAGLAAAPHTADLAGHVAESVVGAYLGGIPGLDLNHLPARGAEPEVDVVLSVGARRIPLEVKYRQRVDPHKDTDGLRAFLEKRANNAEFGVLVTLHDDVEIRDPRIVAVSLASLLLVR
jgi:predicted AAA+ superfamily ATPase